MIRCYILSSGAVLGSLPGTVCRSGFSSRPVFSQTLHNPDANTAISHAAINLRIVPGPSMSFQLTVFLCK